MYRHVLDVAVQPLVAMVELKGDVDRLDQLATLAEKHALQSPASDVRAALAAQLGWW